MPHEAFSDETLMAYADGELDAETVLAIENALEVDPVLAGRLAVFTGTRDVLAHAARARPPEPVPDDLMARVWATLDEAADREVDTVTPFLARKIGNGPRNAWWPTALAASLALAFGLGAGYFLARDTAPGPAPLQVALLETEGLEPALSQLLSGEERQLPAGVLRMIASFRDDRGGFCREYEFDAAGGRTVVAVTCREGAAWETRLAIAANAGTESGYAPASSLDTLEAYLTAIGAGAALSAEEERAVLEGAGN